MILRAAVSRLSATQSLCIQALGKTQVVTRMVNCAAVGNPCGPGAWLPGACSTAVSLMIEYEAVLTRPQHLLATGLSIEETNAVLYAFAAVIEPLELCFLWRPRLTDQADEMVLETAVN